MNEQAKIEMTEEEREQAVIGVVAGILHSIQMASSLLGLDLCTMQKSVVGSIVANVPADHVECMIRRLELDLAELTARVPGPAEGERVH